MIAKATSKGAAASHSVSTAFAALSNYGGNAEFACNNGGMRQWRTNVGHNRHQNLAGLQLVALFGCGDHPRPTFDHAFHTWEASDRRAFGYAGATARIEYVAAPLWVCRPLEWIKVPTNERRVRWQCTVVFVERTSRRDTCQGCLIAAKDSQHLIHRQKEQRITHPC